MIYIILAIICAILLIFYTIYQHFYGKYDVYLSGPMTITGRKDLNYPLFNEITKELRRKGIKIFNPAKTNKVGTPHHICMLTDLNAVVNRCKEVYCLEGWRKSPGANAEIFSAFMCGKKVYEINPYSWENYKTINLRPVNLKSYKLPYEFDPPIVDPYRDFHYVPTRMLKNNDCFDNNREKLFYD